MNLKNILKYIAATFIISTNLSGVFAPSNTFAPYDPNLRLPKCSNMRIHLGANAEYGQSNSARNWEGDKHNVLQIHDKCQDAITMLKNPSCAIKDKVTSVYDELYSAWGSQILSAPLCLQGEYRELNLTFFGKYFFKNFIGGDLGIDVHIPVLWKKIENVKWNPITRAANPLIPNYFQQKYLASCQDFNTLIKDLGNLTFDDWSKSGIGDVVVMLEWLKSFKQNKEALKNVDLYLKVGLSCPTADKRDIDQAFSMSLGNDGALGLPLGFGIYLDFKRNIRVGGDVDFLVLFNETHERRLKTSSDQTEFLLLNKGDATLDPGLTWKFNIFLQAYHFYKGLSLKLAYEYIKHDQDTLYEKCDIYDRIIINSANSLKEWNTHNLIFQINLDSFMWEKAITRPQISLFYKLAITGRNVINMDTFGGQIGFNF